VGAKGLTAHKIAPPKPRSSSIVPGRVVLICQSCAVSFAEDDCKSTKGHLLQSLIEAFPSPLNCFALQPALRRASSGRLSLDPHPILPGNEAARSKNP